MRRPVEKIARVCHREAGSRLSRGHISPTSINCFWRSLLLGVPLDGSVHLQRFDLHRRRARRGQLQLHDERVDPGKPLAPRPAFGAGHGEGGARNGKTRRRPGGLVPEIGSRWLILQENGHLHIKCVNVPPFERRLLLTVWQRVFPPPGVVGET